mmetsp:Transcript_29268/g.43185  ORF Transcript_29268/g.43185 Transcript_29268/m.43185 type:complete len:704 (+) Transcript_29268:1-2112(+)
MTSSAAEEEEETNTGTSVVLVEEKQETTVEDETTTQVEVVPTVVEESKNEENSNTQETTVVVATSSQLEAVVEPSLPVVVVVENNESSNEQETTVTVTTDQAITQAAETTNTVPLSQETASTQLLQAAAAVESSSPGVKEELSSNEAKKTVTAEQAITQAQTVGTSVDVVEGNESAEISIQAQDESTAPQQETSSVILVVSNNNNNIVGNEQSSSSSSSSFNNEETKVTTTATEQAITQAAAVEATTTTIMQEGATTTTSPQLLLSNEVVTSPSLVEEAKNNDETKITATEQAITTQAALDTTITQGTAMTSSSSSSSGDVIITNHLEESTEEQKVIDILHQTHRDMCNESDDDELLANNNNAPPLPYERCDPNGTVIRIPLVLADDDDDLSNALKHILLGAIASFEQNRCFFVDETNNSNNKLNPADANNNNGVKHGFLRKYMEPIGLSIDHPIVVKALQESRVKTILGTESNTYRRAYGQYTTIANLGLEQVEGHNLKRNLIRRLWRPLPEYRQSSCAALQNTHHLTPGDYIALSVITSRRRRSDGSGPSLEEYLIEAQKHMYRFASFEQNQQVPKIFVATDDCSVVSEFIKMRPDWKFTSECNIVPEEVSNTNNNKVLVVDAAATAEEGDHDADFTKFFTEIYALTMSRVFIGVSSTTTDDNHNNNSMSWWIYFLRSFRHSFILLDKPKGEPDSYIYDNW